MAATKENFGQFELEHGVPNVGSSDPYGGDITATALPKDGNTPNLLIAPEPANVEGGADKVRYGAEGWQNTHGTDAISDVYGYIRNACRQPTADSIITITPNFTVPAGKKVRLLYQKLDGSEYAEWKPFSGALAITSSLQCKSGKFRRLQICDANGIPEDFIPVGKYMSVSANIPMGILRGAAVDGEAGDTILTPEFRIGWNVEKNVGQVVGNRLTPPEDVEFTDGVRMAGYDQSIPIPEDGHLAAGEWCQLFVESTLFAGAEPPLGSGGQNKPNFRIGGSA